MFAEKASSTPDRLFAEDDGQYVLFEQAPLTGSWILQGIATKELYSAWEAQISQTKGPPILSEFDLGKYTEFMQYAVVHSVKNKVPYVFEVEFVGYECALILGMSHERRELGPGSTSVNAEDVYKRLSDAVVCKHPHFCVKTLGWQGRSLTKYEVLVLPFGKIDSESTVALFSVMSFSSGFASKYWLVSGV